jgi:glucokinase
MDRRGPPCPCGNRGCWEAFVSGTALGRSAAELSAGDPGGPTARFAGSDAPSAEHLQAAAEAGDEAAAAILERAGTWLGRGLANLVCVFDPDLVVVGGRVAALGERLLDPAKRVVRTEVSGAPYRSETPIVPAALGEDAGLVGAALLARESS